MYILDVVNFSSTISQVGYPVSSLSIKFAIASDISCTALSTMSCVASWFSNTTLPASKALFNAFAVSSVLLVKSIASASLILALRLSLFTSVSWPFS